MVRGMSEQIPFNKDAENGLVGAAIVEPSVVERVDIRPQDFYISSNRIIWSTVIELQRKGIHPDVITLSEQLSIQGELDQIGGQAAVTGLVVNSVSAMGAEDYAKIVKDNSKRREVLKVAKTMARDALNKDRSVNINGYIDTLVSSERPDQGAVHWSEYSRELNDEIAERRDNPPVDGIWGIPTGFGGLDRVTGGLQKGESCLISGEPGVGKSMLAVQACTQMARHSPGAIYSLEMHGKAVMRRVVSAAAKVPNRALKTGQAPQAEIDRAVDELNRLPVYMSDAIGWDVTSLRADLSRLRLMYGIEWFMFDYLLLAGDMPGYSETERTGAISKGMKLTCRHLDLAGVIIHSMNKDGMRAEIPEMHNLRGSGQVPYDADLILFLTEFQPMSMTDQDIPFDDKNNMRTLFFGKGR